MDQVKIPLLLTNSSRLAATEKLKSKLKSLALILPLFFFFLSCLPSFGEGRIVTAILSETGGSPTRPASKGAVVLNFAYLGQFG